MIEGLIMMLIGAALFIAVPSLRHAEHRRELGQDLVIANPLVTAFPVAVPSPSLDALAHDADAALEQDALIRGVQAISETYRSA